MRRLRRPAAQRGFTLLETLVGLVLLGLVLTLVLSTFARLPAALERLWAKQAAYRTAEAVLEALRAGLVPIAPGELELPLADFGGGEPLGTGSRLRLNVVPEPQAGLSLVRVQISYTVRGEPAEAALETLTWRP
jgi:prepilin-type N-terminal cleavage/methylation domain-containing protein